MSTNDTITPNDFETEWNKRFDECENTHEAFVLTCGALLGFLNHIRGEQFDPRREHPNTWPALLARTMLRISRMQRRTRAHTAWLQSAKKTVAAMRDHGVSVPN